MKIAAIKNLVESYQLNQLKLAEVALLEESTPEIIIEGADEGEQLTHLLGAIWILEQVENGSNLKDAIRAFSQRVRTSIQ